jgi:hypothetical protein
MALDGIIINHFLVNIAVLVGMALDGIIMNHFPVNNAVFLRRALDGIFIILAFLILSTTVQLNQRP